MDREGWTKTKRGRVVWGRPVHLWTGHDLARVAFAMIERKKNIYEAFVLVLDFEISLMNMLLDKIIANPVLLLIRNILQFTRDHPDIANPIDLLTAIMGDIFKPNP